MLCVLKLGFAHAAAKLNNVAVFLLPLGAFNFFSYVCQHRATSFYRSNHIAQMQIIEDIKLLFLQWAGEEALTVFPLPQSGSARRYFRLKSATHEVIGVYNADIKENRAFMAFTSHFTSHNLSVPALLAVSKDETSYLLQDLGDITLYQLVNARPAGTPLPADVQVLYRNAISELIKFQVVSGRDLDYRYCYPRQHFDRQSIMWDLHYFKYYFLKPNGIVFDEQLLEDDFVRLADILLEAKADYFMFRDFQARNIMVHDNKLWFIDYQGGRQGTLQYDLASLLFQVKARLTPEFREEMLQHYLLELRSFLHVDENEFIKHYYAFVLVRLMQVAGAYGFRGYLEKKSHFLQSIPYVVKEMKWYLENINLPADLPELGAALSKMGGLNIAVPADDLLGKLTVNISSFSFMKGIPTDYTGNGGGFVFDCRALPNPGRFPAYQSLTGCDEPVIKFLEGNAEVEEFLHHATLLVDQSVKRYIERGFSHLQVNFGCTGGQHRSVYCARRLAAHLKAVFQVKVILGHVQIKSHE